MHTFDQNKMTHSHNRVLLKHQYPVLTTTIRLDNFQPFGRAGQDSKFNGRSGHRSSIMRSPKGQKAQRRKKRTPESDSCVVTLRWDASGGGEWRAGAGVCGWGLVNQNSGNRSFFGARHAHSKMHCCRRPDR